MASPVDISFIGYFIPIFAFLLVFIVVYAVLMKTKVLGENPAVSLFISFIMASFFIVEVQLVDFVTFTSSWFSVILIIFFLMFLLLAFMPGDKPLAFLEKGWVSWVVLGLLIVFFVLSSSFIFNWAINWDFIGSSADSEWFGVVLLLVIGAIVSVVLTKAK